MNDANVHPSKRTWFAYSPRMQPPASKQVSFAEKRGPPSIGSLPGQSANFHNGGPSAPVGTSFAEPGCPLTTLKGTPSFVKAILADQMPSASMSSLLLTRRPATAGYA